MCGILRAQKVTDLIRRVSISPLLTIVAFKCFAISVARVAIKSKFQGMQPSKGSGLFFSMVFKSTLEIIALLESSKISDKSGRVRP